MYLPWYVIYWKPLTETTTTTKLSSMMGPLSKSNNTNIQIRKKLVVHHKELYPHGTKQICV